MGSGQGQRPEQGTGAGQKREAAALLLRSRADSEQVPLWGVYERDGGRGQGLQSRLGLWAWRVIDVPSPLSSPVAWALTQGLAAVTLLGHLSGPGCSSLLKRKWPGPCRASPFPSAASLWGSQNSSRMDQGVCGPCHGPLWVHGGNPGAWLQPFHAPTLAGLGSGSSRDKKVRGCRWLPTLWVHVPVWLHHGFPASCSNTETTVTQPHPWLTSLSSQ